MGVVSERWRIVRYRNSDLYPGFLVTEERRTDWMRERVTWIEGGGVWFAYCCDGGARE